MIKFKKAKVRNFTSVGTKSVSIDFNKEPTTLVRGKNGSGKCVRGNTKIDIKIQDVEIYKKFEEFMKNR